MMPTRAELLSSIRAAVRFALPYWASVLVVSLADSELLLALDREGHSRWEFPEPSWQGTDARRDGEALIGEIERLRAEGWDYLLVPAPAFGWLDRHRELREHLEHEYRPVLKQDACLIFQLEKRDTSLGGTAPDGLPLPPADMIGLVGGTMSPGSFFESGASTARWITEMLQENGTGGQDLAAILDFGCGCGRVIRHWREATGASLHGTDYNPHLVAWCRANLRFADFNVNGPEPPLPYREATFDLIYAMSVLTHLQESSQMSWMTELKRVLKHGGRLLVTVHGRSYLDWLDPAEAKSFESGNLVVRQSELSGSDFCATFHPEQFVRDTLGQGLEVLDYSTAPVRDAHQDAVLFRKP
jgi:SAM-dependent methyltransferase